MQMAPGTWQNAEAGFHTTHWSVVTVATQSPFSEAARQALSDLCQAYWPPLYAFLRRRGYPPSDAQDLTQGFFAFLLEHEVFSQADRQKGRLRTFLLRALQNFVADEYDRAQRLKRGGGQQMVCFDHHLSEVEAIVAAPTPLDATGCYDRLWSCAMINQAWERLHREYDAAGKGQLLEELKPFLIGATAQPSQKAVADRLGLPPVALRKALLALRQRYREVLRMAVAATVSDPAEVNEELHYLYRLLLS